MHRGFIKLYRKITEWEWYRSSETLHIFLHLLVTANHKQSNYMGYTIERGQVVCGRNQLSLDTKVSSQSIRTCLERLKSTNEITIKSTNRFSIITLCHYELYQEQENKINQQTPSQSTNDQPAINQQLTTSKECKNERMKENTIPPISPNGDGVFAEFWKVYPRKVGKGSAIKAWKKIKTPSDTLALIVAALEWQCKSEQWTKDNGQYIPNPATYLNQRRWEDEPTKTRTAIDILREQGVIS